jgi:hypothetical protein
MGRHVKQPADQRGDPRQRPALILTPAMRGRPHIQLGPQQPVQLIGKEPVPAPPGPVETNAACPPARQRRRHW